jgi:hypothetical protein
MPSDQSMPPAPTLWLAAHGRRSFIRDLPALVRIGNYVDTQTAGRYAFREGSIVWGSRADVEEWLSLRASDYS